MTTLTEFLLARIAEDEESARGPILLEHKGYKPTPELSRWRFQPDGYGFNEGDVDWDWDDPGPYPERLKVTSSSEDSSVGEAAGRHIARWDPARVLAECEAKRRIIDWCRHVEVFPANRVADGVLRLLALPYADHPDYDESWTT